MQSGFIALPKNETPELDTGLTEKTWVILMDLAQSAN